MNNYLHTPFKNSGSNLLSVAKDNKYLVSLFFQNEKETIFFLETALVNKNFSSLIYHAHVLYGYGSIFSLPVICAISKAIIESALKEDTVLAFKAISHLKTFFQKVKISYS